MEQIVNLPIRNRFSGNDTREPLRVAVHRGPEVVSSFLRTYRVWQRPITVFLDRYLKPGDVFVDVGANIGYFAIIAASAVGPRGRVHCYEPEPENYRMLLENSALNALSNMKCNQAAVADKRGLATLHTSDSNRGAHSLLAKKGLAGQLSVPVTTLDEEFLRSDTPAAVTMVKIDVQGADLLVLKGMRGLIARQSRKPVILMEFSALEWASRDPRLETLEAFVQENGYRLHAFIHAERPSVIPPGISVSTLRAISDDFNRHDEDAEFDIMLMPGTA